MAKSNYRERIRNYFRDRPEVAAVYLYGSFSKKSEREDSDIDIAVLSVRCADGTDCKERRLDYITGLSGMIDSEIDLVMLEDAGELLCYQVIKYGECLIENDPVANRRFKADKVLQFLDFKPYMERAGKGMVEAMKRGASRG